VVLEKEIDPANAECYSDTTEVTGGHAVPQGYNRADKVSANKIVDAGRSIMLGETNTDNRIPC